MQTIDNPALTTLERRNLAIPSPQRVGNKVVGDFYPLQREELIALRKAGDINNAAYVHFALRYENPFCDRPVEIVPKEFAQRWEIPLSSLYEAIAKLKSKGVLLIQAGRMLVNWALSSISSPKGDRLESSTEVATVSLEATDEPSSLAPEESISPSSPVSLEKSPDLPTPAPAVTAQLSSLTQIGSIISSVGVLPEKSSESASPVQVDQSSSGLTPDLKAELNEIGLHLNEDIQSAIAQAHPSQIKSTIAKIKDYKGEIRSVNALFLHLLPKQKISDSPQKGENAKKSLSSEFLVWYKSAIAEGLVVDRHPDNLPRDRFNEPKVQIPDGRLIEWKQVQQNEIEPLLDPDETKHKFAEICKKLPFLNRNPQKT
jgi:hypothetical protein